MIPTLIDLDNIPFEDQHYKIGETNCEFDLLELHNWLK